jgi:hypothetical protein
MATIYALLADALTPAQGRAFTDAVVDSGGGLVSLVTPRLAVVEGDSTTVAAIEQHIGDAVVAVSVDDVTPLALAAFGAPELAEMIAILALTTPAATAAAEAVRPFAGEDWRGFSCLVGEPS